MYEDLKKIYQDIFKELQKVKAIQTNFEQIMGDLRTISGNDVTALKDSISLHSNDYSIRTQLRDISGIVSNSLAYYLAHLWSKGSNEFGLNNYQLVLVLQNNLKYNPDLIKSQNKVKKAIQEEYKSLTGMDMSDFVIDDSFWKNTLFIIDNFAINGKSPSFAWLSKKTNVLIVGNKFYHGITEILAINGFVMHEVGLSIPQIVIQPQRVTIAGTDVLVVEQSLRQTFLQKTPTGQGVIDYTNPTLMKDHDGKIQLVGSERRAEHEYPLVLNLINLLGQILENKANLENYHIRPFTKVADWYAAATTGHIDNKFYSYNIGGHLLVRTSFDNYFSDLGPIEQILPNIINDIEQTAYSFLRSHITEQDIAEGNGARILIEKIQKYLVDKYILKSIENTGSFTFGYKSTPVATAAFSATEERKQQEAELLKVSSDLEFRPTYKDLIRKIFLLPSEKVTSNIRDILVNSVRDITIDESLYTLVACLFIAEPSRCPQTLLPTIMMLDLCKAQTVSWQDAIFQMSLLNSIEPRHTSLIKTVLSNFGGSLPMTHDGSYFQAQLITNSPLQQRKILTWVEYKSILIMLNWVQLAQNVKPDSILTDSNDIINAVINGHFSDRMANFASIESSDYGIQVNLEAQTILTHLDRLEDNFSGKRFVVFSVPKGQNLPFIQFPSISGNNGLQQNLQDDTNGILSEVINFEEMLGNIEGSQYTSKKPDYQYVMDRFLADQNLYTVEAGAGGNCFFHAIARQLAIINNNEKIINHEELRQFAIQYMTDHPGEFDGFTEDTLDDYIDQMSQNGTWADNPIIQALANEFQFEILIYRINGEINIIRGANPIRTVSVAYTGGHYLSVELLTNQEKDENIELLVQAISSNSLEDSQSATSSDKHKPSSAPTSMPTSSPIDASKSNAISYAHERSFLSPANIGEYESHFKVLAAFLGLDGTI